MTEFSLNGIWEMTGAGFECKGNIPGSVYSFLLDNKLMEDPYYRQNELAAHQLTFSMLQNVSSNQFLLVVWKREKKQRVL